MRDFDDEDDNFPSLEWDYSDNLNLQEFLKDKPSIREKLDFALKDLENTDDEDEKSERFRQHKNALLDGIETLSYTDKLNEEAWDGMIIDEEQKLFLWEQKIKILNQALEEYNIRLDPKNKNLYDFLNNELKTLSTEKRGEINGYEYKNTKIIKRNRDKNFVVIDNKKFTEFLDKVKIYTTNSARSEFIDILGNDENIKITARECLNELRNQEKNIIATAKNSIELQNRQPEINEIEKAIENLKENKKTNIRKGIIMRTLEGKISSMKEWVKENKTSLGIGGSSFLLTLISGIATTIPILEKLKKGVKAISHMGSVIEKVGKKIRNMGNQLNSILNTPTKTTGTLISLLGNLIKEINNIPFIGILFPIFIIFGILALIIKLWRGE